MTWPPTAPDISVLAAAIGLVGGTCVMTLVTLTELGRALLHVVPDITRAAFARTFAAPLAWIPPPGRVTRALTWVAIFLSLGAILTLQFVPDPFVRTRPDTSRFAPLFSLDKGRWMLALQVGVATLCTAVASWSPQTVTGRWALVLFVQAGCLVAISANGVPTALLAVDFALLCLALLLCVWSPPDTPGHPSLRPAVRGFLTLTVAGSVLGWAGFALMSQGGEASAIARPLLTVGLLLRCGVVPLHPGWVGLHARASAPVAMMATGAVLPVCLLTLLRFGSPVPPAFSSLACWAGLLAAVTGYLMASRDDDLRSAVGRWVSAAGTFGVALGLPDLGPVRLFPEQFLVGLAAAGTMATYLAGLIEHDAGHRDVSRLRGFAARSPSTLTWMLLSALLLCVAPASPGFVAIFLSPGGYTTVPALLFVLATGPCVLTLHRVFLGLPRSRLVDETPIDLTARQRLVLVLLLTTSVAAVALPSTLIRP